MHTMTPLTNGPSGTTRLLTLFGPSVLFALLSAIFLWQPIVTGQTFLPTDLVYKHDDVWKLQSAPPGMRIAQNELLSDVTLYYYPYAHYAIERLSSGEFPLWNPYILGGSPFFAAAQGAVLDPINLVIFLAGPEAYWTWGAFIRLFLLGFGTFGFLRALGRGMPGALAGGVVFMLGGFVTVWLNYSVITTLTWMPLMFWATVRLLHYGSAVWVAAVAAAFGALMLGGHPETQFLAGIAWGLFSLFGLVVVHKESGFSVQVRRFGTLVAAALLGLGLALVQLVPFFLFLGQSSAVAERLSSAPPFDLGDMGLRWAVTFFPNFGGTPTLSNYWLPRTINTNFNDQTTYPGLLALLLALVGVVYWWKSRERQTDRWPYFFALFGIVSFWLAVRAPGAGLVRELPVFNVGHGVRWGETLLLCVSALSAWGVDSIVSVRTRRGQVRDTGLWLGSAALVGFGVLLLIYMGIRDGSWDVLWGARLKHEVITEWFHPTSFVLYLPLAFVLGAAIVAIVRWQSWIRPAGAGTGLILLLYAEMWTFGSRYNPVTPRDAVYPEAPTTTYLIDNLGHERFAGLLHTLRPNASMLFRVRDIRGFEDVAFADVVDFLGRFARGASLTRGKADLELTRSEHRALSVSGVKYLLTVRKPRVEGSAASYQYQTMHNRVAIYENLEVLDRARFRVSSRVAASTDEATALLMSDNYDPTREVVITADGEKELRGNLGGFAGPISWVTDSPERVILSVDAPQEGYLVLSDSFAPEWQAKLDGIEVPILQADVIYRAVKVPAGSHTVEFVYRPTAFFWSAIASSLSALTIFSIAVVHLVRSRRITRRATAL